MEMKKPRYLIEYDAKGFVSGFYIIRDENKDKYLLESLSSIIFEIREMGLWRSFDPNCDIEIDDFYEKRKADIADCEIFDFQESALGCLTRCLKDDARRREDDAG